MSNILVNNTAVVGTDNKTPIYNKEGRFAIYSLPELWDGTVGEKRYIPNVGDLVIDTMRTTSSKFWIVKALNVDLIPVLAPWGDEPTLGMDLSDILTAPGNSTHNATYRAYLDTSVYPYVLSIENRLSFKGTQATYVKIFRGAVTEGLLQSGATKVISGYFDNQGNLTSDSVPLEQVGPSIHRVVDDVVEHMLKRNECVVRPSYTRSEIPDNEILTVVAYSAEHTMVSKTQVVVENCSFLNARNAQTKRITHISLVSPFISETDEWLIKLPINVPLQGLYLKGRVHYNDGSYKEMPVDNSKFTVMGMESYLATMINQKVPIFLRYTLNQEEAAENASVGHDRFISQRYDIRTIEARGAYYLKLYCFPEWINSVTGYRLRWWLYNGERNAVYDVTNLVQHAINTQGFDPVKYGVTQHLTVSVNLKDVNPLFDSYRFAQTVSIVLWREGLEENTNWSIRYDPSQEPAYGDDTHALLQFINYNYWKINLHSECTSLNQWLEKLYLRGKPLIDPRREVNAPLPTHFRLMISGTTTIELPVSEWNRTQSITNGLKVGDTVYLQWILKTPETNLELGISGLPCHSSKNQDLPEVMPVPLVG